MDLAVNQQITLGLNPEDVLTLLNNAAGGDEALLTIVSGGNVNAGTVYTHRGNQDYSFKAATRLVLSCTKGSLSYSVLTKVLVNGQKPAGSQLVQDVTQAQLDSPTPAMIADTNTVYKLSVAPFTRYQSDGTSLVQMGSGAGSAGTKIISASPYTITNSDAGKTLLWQGAGALSVVCPRTDTGQTEAAINAGWEALVQIDVGAGNATFSAASGTTVVSKSGSFVTNGQNSQVLVKMNVDNQWNISGDLGSLTSADISDFTSAVNALIAASGGGGGSLSWSEPGTYYNLPQLGAGGTNTGGTHSGNFTVIGAATTATTSLNGKGYKRRNKITAGSSAIDTGAGVRSSTTGVAYMPNASNAEALLGEFIQGPADAYTGARGAMGLNWNGGSSVSMVNEPRTFTNTIQMGYSSDQSPRQYVVMVNDGSGNATERALNSGSGFPCDGNETDYYKFKFKATGGGSKNVDWKAINLITGLSVTGNETTNIPADDQQLQAYNYRASNSTTAGQVAINYGGSLGGAVVQY